MRRAFLLAATLVLAGCEADPIAARATLTELGFHGIALSAGAADRSALRVGRALRRAVPGRDRGRPHRERHPLLG